MGHLNHLCQFHLAYTSKLWIKGTQPTLLKSRGVSFRGFTIVIIFEVRCERLING